MTPVDALDTLIVMGEKHAADKARRLIDARLSFDQDIYVKNFEITIRLLGGLLSAYELSGDQQLPTTLRFDDIVFNTEAHPLRRAPVSADATGEARSPR
jgi:hypothetical protein